MRLNLGCGFLPLSGYTNIDRRSLPTVDVVCDLDVFPWPFHDDTASEIVAFDIFEHLNDVVGAMDQCWRILQNGGTLQIRGPLPDSPNLWLDVTHRRAFIDHSFDYFDWTTSLGKQYRYGTASWKLVEARREGTNILFVLRKPWPLLS